MTPYIRKHLGLREEYLFFPPNGVRLIVVMRLMRALNDHWVEERPGGRQIKHIVHPFIGELSRMSSTKPDNELFMELRDGKNSFDGHDGDDIHTIYKAYFENSPRVRIRVVADAVVGGPLPYFLVLGLIGLPLSLHIYFDFPLPFSHIVSTILLISLLGMMWIKLKHDRRHALRWLRFVIEKPITNEEKKEFDDVIKELDEYEHEQSNKNGNNNKSFHNRDVLINDPGNLHISLLGSGEKKSDTPNAALAAFHRALAKMKAHKRANT